MTSLYLLCCGLLTLTAVNGTNTFLKLIPGLIWKIMFGVKVNVQNIDSKHSTFCKMTAFMKPLVFDFSKSS